MNNPYRQKGFASVLGVLIAIGLMTSILFGVVIPLKQQWDKENSARIAGNYIAQFNTAVRHFYAFYGTASVPTGNRTGVDWLKNNTTCFGGAYSGGYSAPETGNPTQGFLPCAFPNLLPYNVLPSTTLTVNANNFTATTTFGPFKETGNPNIELGIAGLVFRAAEAQTWDEGTRASGIFFSYSVDSDPTSGTFGVLTATATSQFAAAEVYLPRNGSLAMQGNLDMGNNNIINVKDIYLKGKEKWASSGVHDVGVYASSDIVTKPTCPNGSPQIFATSGYFSQNSSGNALGAVQTYATSINSTQWRVYLRVLTSSGWTYPTSTYGKIIALTKCT